MNRLDNRFVRAASVLLVATAAWYMPWMAAHADLRVFWLSIPFVSANLLLATCVLVAALNNWSREVPAEPVAPARQDLPTVAVLLPTAGEPEIQLERTLRSTLAQDWPDDRLCIVVSDDSHRATVREMVKEVAHEHRDALVIYHEPPPIGHPDRRGDAKAGNLNSAVGVARLVAPELEFIETRDADDLVGDGRFLRLVVGQLLSRPDVAYVQTIKEAKVSPGDPFDNIQAQFYRGSLPARNATNSVFPCGSGVVWRRTALEEIDDFPTWNLLEDLQSGIEALRRGWRGLFLPIVGTVGQHAPEDIPNYFQQRGTWALDTMRMTIWGEKRGLDLRQRLHFLELPLFYLQGLATFAFILAPVVGFLFHRYPLQTDLQAYLLHFWPFALAIEGFFIALFRPLSYEHVLRARITWVGLAPVYVKASFRALVLGRNRKPVYKVTRKTSQPAWYWREAGVQAGLFIALVGSALLAVLHESLLRQFDLGSAYWALLYALLLGGFLRLSWFGTRPNGVRAGLRRGETVAEGVTTSNGDVPAVHALDSPVAP